jgi:NTE family protein
MQDIYAGFRAATDTGKIGIALSGGGFRAALFHIGVLARLAELDLLRGVEVISTVSGGSIIGAYYYLKVKELLEGRRQDGAIPSAAAYLRIVQEVEVGFLAAVQKNMRMRAFGDRRKNARMLREGYSPTERMGELYTQHFFAPLFDREIFLKDLPVQAVHGSQTGCKIPRLILNATTLNNGHLWQFTGEFVGEAVWQYDQTLMDKRYFNSDGNSPGQRARLNGITLGQAVAASCCVPGLFEPLSLSGLYETELGEAIEVCLVDGGVFDNQGLVSLFDENCTHIVCSDASDPLKKELNPPTRMLNVAMRANEIMMDRIRTEVLNELLSSYPGRYAFFHLGDEMGEHLFPNEAQRIVDALSYIRTDLDSFSDLEAYTLMYYGYQSSGEKFGATAPDMASAKSAPAWNFLTIDNFLTDDGQREKLLAHLKVGANPFFKVFYLKKALPYIVVLGALAFPVGVSVYLLSLLPPMPPMAWGLLLLLLLSILAYSQNARIIQLLDRIPSFRRGRRRLAKAMTPLGIPMIVGLVGAVVTWVHLRIFDRLFLWYGRVET